jgi:DNA polymerase-3 subunit gamma/tau
VPAPPGGQEVKPPVTIPSPNDPVQKKAEPIKEETPKPKVEEEEGGSIVDQIIKAEADPSKATKALKVVPFGQRKLVSSLSLKKKEAAAEDEEETFEDLSKKPRTPFTEEELQGKWNSFCYTIKKEGKAGLYATLTKNPVVIKENFQLELLLDNHIQETEVNTSKAALLGFLRKQLNNYGIDLKTVIIESAAESKHLTNKDKFLQMVEKNPVLGELRERLGLDIEY